MKNIAIIPARSGSKGLPDKNIRLLGGKPLLAYTIEAAIQSGCFDTVHVSTDSEHYAEIARQYGADVPFLRSAALATDTASTWDAVREALCRYAELGKTFDTMMLMQPTSRTSFTAIFPTSIVMTCASLPCRPDKNAPLSENPMLP